MNARYLRCVIREQIDRVESPKCEIPDRQRHEALTRRPPRAGARSRGCRARWSGPAACTTATAETALPSHSTTQGTAQGPWERSGHGPPPLLHCQSEQAVFLNDVLSSLHGEVGLSFPCPAVSCTSSEHYFVHPATNTVHVPLSEAAFLLHMPDFYHELGHLLFDDLDQNARYRPVLDGMDDAIGSIDGWYSQLAVQLERESAPASVREDMEWMWDRWKSIWFQEVFCDLFALFAAGPAYAHSNLHLVSKADLDIHELRIHARQDHPSGEARMRLLDAGLRLLGREHEADHVMDEWGTMAQFCADPPPGYDHAFPSTLLREIATAILPTFERAGLRGYSGGGQASDGSGDDTVAGLLNDAWRGFWRDTDCGFRDMEKTMISRLAAATRRISAVR